MDAESQKLALAVVGLAQVAITEGTENADPLIRGHLRSMVEHGHIFPKQRDEIIAAWEVLRRQIEEEKPGGITEVSFNELSNRLHLHAA